MNRIIKALLLALIILMPITSCTLIIDSVAEEDPPLERDNPGDPNNPNAELPDIELSGNFTFGQTFTVDSESFTISWALAGAGISEGLIYSYRLAEPGEDINTLPFIDLGDLTSISFNVFETLGSDTYNFEVQVSSDVNTTLSPKVFAGSFQVDAYQDETFLFLPNRIEDNGDGSYTAKLFVDEIDAADEITAYRLDIIYDNTSLSTSNSDVTVYDDSRSFLFRSNAQLITFKEVIGDTIRIESGAAGTNFAPISGSGAVGEINFRLNNGFSSGIIRISPTSILKTINGDDVPIANFVQAEINQSF